MRSRRLFPPRSSGPAPTPGAEGFDTDAATATYEDNFGCGNVFNARYVRYRVPHKTRDEVRRYTVYAYTYQASYVTWNDERSALESSRSHDNLLGDIDQLSDEQLTEMFGTGNEPFRHCLRARPPGAGVPARGLAHRAGGGRRRPGPFRLILVFRVSLRP